MTEPRVYDVIWDERNPLKATILQVTGNRFAFRVKKETPEERLERKALEAASTPFQNLQRLMQGHFDSKWRATELYPWFEQNAPGYKVGPSTNEGVVVHFDHISHLLLFKLTWT